jgi:citrate lyase subunit beta/citryl-CoA lyase
VILARSALYVPGDATVKLERSFERGADLIIVDLEDAVAPSAKERARREVAAWLPSGPPIPVWVRVNNSDQLDNDLEAIVRPGLSGICLPKCSTHEELDRLDRRLAKCESFQKMPPGSVGVWPLIESAAGLLAAASIATSPRVAGLQIGEIDLIAG